MTTEKMLARRPAKSVFGGYSAVILEKRGRRHHQSRTKITGLTKSESVVYPVKRGRRHLSLGIAVSISKRRTTADRRYFFVRCHAFAFNGRALVGERSRSPVSFCTGTATLPCAWPPQLQLGAGFVEPAKGGRTMRLALPARSEQTIPLVYIDILQCAQRALREATLAASDLDALDITGNALRQLVDIARPEVRHD
ncbi:MULTISPECIES: hypothetical protein [unclassified Caballeronia]|uniref:hypothetical protein n=1 Tax=unclassified Caballeronia TaxID=2646786 RepID=UPI0028635979|nr:MULTISPECIES: hypothetical protein [unclassified Caballeronia]MDR5772907.1 hypothetical protein [Caballeronia sp. LZ002]MDR5848341.1 hypothetical protein [Caballeronia sp. LZ003]